jgi:hypothetical protein
MKYRRVQAKVVPRTDYKAYVRKEEGEGEGAVRDEHVLRVLGVIKTTRRHKPDDYQRTHGINNSGAFAGI